MNAFVTGVGTGLGAMPGTDPFEATAVVNGELDLPHLVELPARGLGSDPIGRMSAILIDMPLDVTTTAYRLSARPSGVGRAAAGFLAADLDAVEQVWDSAGFVGTGRAVKVQVCGPFTFSAQAELANGHKVLRDGGAWSDVVASTAEGVRRHVAEVRRRLGASVIVQLDEPAVGAVIDGTVTPLTRFDTISPVGLAEVAAALREVVDAAEVPVVIRSGVAPRWDLIENLPGPAHCVAPPGESAQALDGIGMILDRGDVVMIGAVPTDVAAARTDRLRPETIATGLAAITDRIGLSRNVLREQVILTPDAGLADLEPAHAKKVLSVCAAAGELLATDPAAL